MFLFSSFYHKIRKKETHYRLPSVVGEGFNIVLFLIGENRGFQQSKQHSSGPPKVFDQQENGSTRIGTITSFFFFSLVFPLCMSLCSSSSGSQTMVCVYTSGDT